MNTLRVAIVSMLLVMAGSGRVDGSSIRGCIHLNNRPEVYALSIGYMSFIFIDNALTKDERSEMRSTFMSEGVFSGISPFIVRQVLVIEDRTKPTHSWHWGDGYSMWVQEEFVCTFDKPLVYDLLSQKYRDPVF